MGTRSKRTPTLEEARDALAAVSTTDYECDVCPFKSTGWPTKAAAVRRGKQHQSEHETGTPMPELNTKES